MNVGDELTTFAFDAYARDGVDAACVHLQERYDLDVNVVLAAAFVGAVRRRALSVVEFEMLRAHTASWHDEVVVPLRTLRRRLRTGPPPAPSDDGDELRRTIADAELSAERIELQYLGTAIDSTESEESTAPAGELASICIGVVVTGYDGVLSRPEDRAAVQVIAAAAASMPRPGTDGSHG